MFEEPLSESEIAALFTPEQRIEILTEALRHHPDFAEIMAELGSAPRPVEFLEEKLETWSIAQLLEEREGDVGPGTSIDDLIAELGLQDYVEANVSSWIDRQG